MANEGETPVIARPMNGPKQSGRNLRSRFHPRERLSTSYGGQVTQASVRDDRD